MRESAPLPLAFVALAFVTMSFLTVAIAGAGTPLPSPPAPPPFDAGNYRHPTTIDNPYFPLTEGTTFVYHTTKNGEAQDDVVVVTSDTKVILGVTCRAVRDTVSVKGQVVEDTTDFYAQDDDGNVWYMGEDSKQYKNGVLASTEGSWQAGVNGAQPGYIMEANPQVGDVYRQEYLPGEAEDLAQVLSLTASVSVPAGTWQGNAIRTREWSPLEKSVIENKYYAPGVGDVKETTVKGGSAVSVLDSVM